MLNDYVCNEEETGCIRLRKSWWTGKMIAQVGYRFQYRRSNGRILYDGKWFYKWRDATQKDFVDTSLVQLRRVKTDSTIYHPTE